MSHATDTQPNWHIRNATLEDVVGIVYVQATTWIANYPDRAHGITEEDIRALDWYGKIPQWQHMVKSPDCSVWVAADKGHIYGFVATTHYQDNYEIYEINVLPECQGDGMGSELLQTALGKTAIGAFLQVAVYNYKAQQFYGRYGFDATGARGAFKLPNGKAIPTLYMRRPPRGGQGGSGKIYVYRAKLARKSGIRESTIKWYTESGLLPYIQSAEKRRRRYPLHEAMERLEFITRLQGQGYSLKTIRQKLQ